jgi:hypothetical protein
MRKLYWTAVATGLDSAGLDQAKLGPNEEYQVDARTRQVQYVR